ncbi:MAG: PIN domain-containing protein [Patulibacter sp.]
MIVDTSALLAFFDENEASHHRVSDAIERATEPLVISPLVIAELDYLVLTRHGSQAARAVAAELAGGAWTIAPVTATHIQAAADYLETYADLPLGLTDAMNMVLATGYRTRTIATLDRRHFSVLRFDNRTAPIIVP